MPTPPLPLRDGPLVKTFDAVVAILREDPVLAGVVKTWSTWDGESVSRMPIASGMLPYLGLTPFSIPSEVMGEGQSVNVLGISLVVAVAGLDRRNFLNFWDAVQDALVRNKPFRTTTVMCYLGDREDRHGGGRAFFHRVISPPMEAFRTRDDAPADFLGGAGKLELRIARTA